MFAQMLTSNQASISKITQQSFTNKLNAAAAKATATQKIYSVKEEITQQCSQEQIKTNPVKSFTSRLA